VADDSPTPPTLLDAIRAAKLAREAPNGSHPATDTPRELVSVQGSAQGSAYGLTALSGEAETVRSAVEGRRNATLNTAALKMFSLAAGGEVRDDHVRDTLAGAAKAAGLGLREIEKTLGSARRKALSQPRTAPNGTLQISVTSEGPIRPPVIDIDPTPIVVDLVRDEIDLETGEVKEVRSDFWETRDVLRHIRDFAYARMCSPWAVLGVAILRALALTPPTVVLPPLVGSIGSLNLFCATVGPPGAGKGAAEGCAADAIIWPADPFTGGPLHVVTTGSGEGIAHQYIHRERSEYVDDQKSVLFSVPEVDTLASLGKGRQGSTLLTQLRSAYSGETLGFSYADVNKRMILPKHTYRLTMVVGVQPERASALLDDSAGGTPQRFIFVPATDSAIASPAPTSPDPIKIKFPDWADVPIGLHDGFRHIPLPDHVRRTVMDTRAANARGELDALDGHALFTRLKVAAAFAIMDARYAVNDEDWELSRVIMNVSDMTRERIVRALESKTEVIEERRNLASARRALVEEDIKADAGIGRVCKTIMKILDDNDGQATWNEFTHRLAARDRDFRQEAFERLEILGQIRVEENGRHRTVIKL